MPTDTQGTQGSQGDITHSTDSVEGVVTVPSAYPFDETTDRIKAALSARGLTLFTQVDHSGEAAQVGLALQPTKLLIFGSPRAGTPLMVAVPLLALDLPLKALVWQDGERTFVSYNSTAYLAERYHLPDALLPNIAGIDALITSALAQS
jgi:uncharacterized protein (DUF302 family)